MTTTGRQPATLARRLRRRARQLGPRGRAQSRAAVTWALGAAAGLPDHTHAARLVGLVAPPPAGLPAYAGKAVSRALVGSSATCLQRCLVLQAWFLGQGQPCEIVMGFRTVDGFEAHAWIPGYHDPEEAAGFIELARVPVPDDGPGGLRPALP